jgi:lactoylglutathione lyase
MAKMIHSMIRVLDEARSIDFYGKAFGLTVADRNQGRTEPYALGEGYGHLAVSVDELRDVHERLTGLGLNPGGIVELNRDGKLFALFFFVTDPDGYKIEVMQRNGRFQ